MLKNVIIYTDGACSGNPGPGGWAAVLIYNQHVKEISGYNKSTTNNRMELFAVIQALRSLKERCHVDIHVDSAYVVEAFQSGWIQTWQQNNWKRKTGEIKNLDLWRALVGECVNHEVNFIKVKGHSDVHYNNRCDELARKEIEKCKSLIEIE